MVYNAESVRLFSYLTPAVLHELMFLVGGIVIGMTIMVIVFERYERRVIDQHMRQVNGLLGRINELARENRRGSDSTPERPSASA